MTIRFGCLALAAALVAGCATRLPSTSFAESAALERAMKGYYAAHASEEQGCCPRPYIDGLTQVSVVENQPDRMVVDIRYLYTDQFKNNRGEKGGQQCLGYGGRSFTLGRDEAGEVKVFEMTGPRRS
jgi:hypothetical protein